MLESFKNSEISIVSFWETEKNIIQFFCSRTSILRQNAVLEKINALLTEKYFETVKPIKADNYDLVQFKAQLDSIT